MISPRELKACYSRGENVSALLRETGGSGYDGERIIEVSYDLQSGSYVDLIRQESVALAHHAYTAEIAHTIRSLGANTVLEAGVGEATTLSRVIEESDASHVAYHGFDLSWSRIAAAQAWLQERGHDNVSLCTASLVDIPYHADAFDVVYTSHAIEPNGGRERAILAELHRVTRQWLVLFEPCFELASDRVKRRMNQFGYCRHIPEFCRELGFDIVRHARVRFPTNPLNPTACTIVRKHSVTEVASQEFACPRFKTSLELRGEAYFSPEALSVYPILAGIPCLRVENAIVASKWPEVVSRRL